MTQPAAVTDDMRAHAAERSVTLERHGDHDQKSHGRRGGAAGAVPGPGWDAEQPHPNPATEAAIVAASGKENGIDVLRACECQFDSPIRADEAVVARGEITGLGRRHVEVRIEVRSEGDGRLLMGGEVVLVRVGSDGAATDITDLHGPSGESQHQGG